MMWRRCLGGGCIRNYAAEQLFTRQGFAETSVSDVARRAGVGVGTLYHHFPDKHAMLLDLIDDWGDRAEANRRTDLDHARFLGDDPRGSGTSDGHHLAQASQLRQAGGRH